PRPGGAGGGPPPDAVVVGYTVQAFRERLGSGTRDLIEHRPLSPEEDSEVDSDD
ncbi:hypothetical protein ABQE44_17725, partial [Mycolicibacterium sp. XJ2546]